MQRERKEAPLRGVGPIEVEFKGSSEFHANLPTCMMTSRTRAGVKVRQLAIENVWGIPNAC